MFSYSAPLPSTSFPRRRARISLSSPALRGESSGVAHEAIKLSYLLPTLGFRIKCGMTIARATAWKRKNASLFSVSYNIMG